MQPAANAPLTGRRRLMLLVDALHASAAAALRHTLLRLANHLALSGVGDAGAAHTAAEAGQQHSYYGSHAPEVGLALLERTAAGVQLQVVYKLSRLQLRDFALAVTRLRGPAAAAGTGAGATGADAAAAAAAPDPRRLVVALRSLVAHVARTAATNAEGGPSAASGSGGGGSNRIVVVTHSLAPLPPGGLLARTLEEAARAHITVSFLALNTQESLQLLRRPRQSAHDPGVAAGGGAAAGGGGAGEEDEGEAAVRRAVAAHSGTAEYDTVLAEPLALERVYMRWVQQLLQPPAHPELLLLLPPAVGLGPDQQPPGGAAVRPEAMLASDAAGGGGGAEGGGGMAVRCVLSSQVAYLAPRVSPCPLCACHGLPTLPAPTRVPDAPSYCQVEGELLLPPHAAPLDPLTVRLGPPGAAGQELRLAGRCPELQEQGLVVADAPFPVTAAEAAAAAAEVAGVPHGEDGHVPRLAPHPHAQLPRLVVQRVVGSGEVDESLVMGWPQVLLPAPPDDDDDDAEGYDEEVEDEALDGRGGHREQQEQYGRRGPTEARREGEDDGAASIPVLLGDGPQQPRPRPQRQRRLAAHELLAALTQVLMQPHCRSGGNDGTSVPAAPAAAGGATAAANGGPCALLAWAYAALCEGPPDRVLPTPTSLRHWEQLVPLSEELTAGGRQRQWQPASAAALDAARAALGLLPGWRIAATAPAASVKDAMSDGEVMQQQPQHPQHSQPQQEAVAVGTAAEVAAAAKEGQEGEQEQQEGEQEGEQDGFSPLMLSSGCHEVLAALLRDSVRLTARPVATAMTPAAGIGGCADGPAAAAAAGAAAGDVTASTAAAAAEAGQPQALNQHLLMLRQPPPHDAYDHSSGQQQEAAGAAAGGGGQREGAGGVAEPVAAEGAHDEVMAAARAGSAAGDHPAQQYQHHQPQQQYGHHFNHQHQHPPQRQSGQAAPPAPHMPQHATAAPAPPIGAAGGTRLRLPSYAAVPSGDGGGGGGGGGSSRGGGASRRRQQQQAQAQAQAQAQPQPGTRAVTGAAAAGGTSKGLPGAVGRAAGGDGRRAALQLTPSSSAAAAAPPAGGNNNNKRG
ncbi:hypothetical protein HXX76_006457 [Chlamydomonas incerta]|uniref:Uncharacterized protein n=1 Tax=Chlamydomonas incerta TaxID=51695 RepID=A0A835T696_CHLIN|nr:hypothetical protein HXX76_006457 [Chlamydomonas incerta]|eukprot:KAG2436938.1 hypothetical protein HXX76_006457 [Chlamydomonas incerta]